MARSVCTKTGKKRYPSYWQARAAANDIRHQSGEQHGTPYQCDHCRGWHLGKSSP